VLHSELLGEQLVEHAVELDDVRDDHLQHTQCTRLSDTSAQIAVGVRALCEPVMTTESLTMSVAVPSEFHSCAEP